MAEDANLVLDPVLKGGGTRPNMILCEACVCCPAVRVLGNP